MLKTMFKVLFLTLLTTVAVAQANSDKEQLISQGREIIGDTFDEYAQKVCKKYDLRCNGIISGYSEKAEVLGGQFRSDKLLPKSEISILIMNLVKEFQEAVNKNEKAKRFLADVPFPADRIVIALSFHNEDFSPWSGEFDAVETFVGKIIYKITGPPESMVFPETLEETFEEVCEATGIVVAPIRSKLSENVKKKQAAAAEAYKAVENK